MPAESDDMAAQVAEGARYGDRDMGCTARHKGLVPDWCGWI